jgi:carboxyl-terminal processing protease
MPPEVMAAATPTPFPTPTLPAPASSPVDASTKAQQLKVFQEIWNRVNTDYVYRDFNGLDWKATGDKYQKLINQGLTQDNFYAAMADMINELGDQHSSFLSPKDVQAMTEEMQGKSDYVGIGGYVDLTIPGRMVVTAVAPGGPAEKAGLLPHDSILKVDGGPVLDANNQPRTLGPAGSTVTITVQTPGQAPHDIKLVRQRITNQPKVDYCLVPGTHIGYIRWLSYADTTVVDQTDNAIKAMTADHPLDGLILDNRYNSGGLIEVLTSLLSLFTKGTVGNFVSGQSTDPYTITPTNLDGSQQVPLVVLTGPDTQSAAEYASGILHLTRGAKLVGEPTGGHVEELYSYNLPDGSLLIMAQRTFQPVGLKNNAWEKHGVTPDVVVPERWDLFTEANDPSIGEAIQLLKK